MTIETKDFLGLEDVSQETIMSILQTGRAMKEILKRRVKKVPTLRGKTIMTLFYEPSTRTSSSFALAGKRLSADVTNLSMKTSSVVKGESLRDTGKTIEAMGAEMVIIRHGMPGAPKLLGETIEARVINAGDGSHEHPTQALLDLFTVQERLKRIEGLKVAIIGDIKHSRVARSNIWGFTRLGAEVKLIGPRTLIPPEFEDLDVEVHNSLDGLLPQLDVVYLLRLQLERQKSGLFPSLQEYRSLYGLTAERLGELKPEAMIMHPGPMNRGVEIDELAAESGQAVIEEQVTNGVAIGMALLYLMAGGRRDNDEIFNQGS